MSVSRALDLTLLPGARELLALHARELPQRDDLCGAFCGSLALRAAFARARTRARTEPNETNAPAGDVRREGEASLERPLHQDTAPGYATLDQSAAPGQATLDQNAAPGQVERDEHGPDQDADQDAVALAAGSVVSARADPAILPAGETGRRDYRLALPTVEDASLSGTTAAGLRTAIEELSRGRVLALPYAGPWTVATLGGLFELAAGLAHPVTLLANLATHHLWGSHPRADQLLGYLLDGERDGPPPDWDVGHFVCVVARLRGPGGVLYGVADTYSSLGVSGVHVQPQERLAAAIERRDMPAGGVLAVVWAEDAPAVRAGAETLGLAEGIWDNGTVAAGAPR